MRHLFNYDIINSMTTPLQNQTSTTQKTTAGVTTTTTVTTTAPATPVVNQSSLGMASVAKSVERRIEEQKKNQATSAKRPLNEILDKTLAVTFGKDKQVPLGDELAFGSTNNISELPERVRNILTAEGISFSPEDRIIHTPGALFFNLVQTTPEGKKYSSFSLHNNPQNSINNEGQEDENNVSELLNNNTDTIPQSIQELSHDKNMLESVIIPEITKPELTPEQVPTETSPAVIGAKEPTAGTLGTIGFSNQQPVQEKEELKFQGTDTKFDNSIFTIHADSAHEQLNSDTVLDTEQLQSGNEQVSVKIQEELPETIQQIPDEIILDQEVKTETYNSPDQSADNQKPQSWQFEKEIIKGPKPAITLEEKIKETTNFSKLHTLIIAESEFADSPSQDVWALIRNYVHGMISIDRIPRDYGLQQKVERLKQDFDREQELLEINKQQSKENENQQESPQSATDFLSSLINQQQSENESLDNQSRSILESLGLSSLDSNSQSEIEPELDSVKLVNESVEIPTSIPEKLQIDDQNQEMQTPVEKLEAVPLVESETVSRNDIYQLFEQKLFQAFGIQKI